MSASHPQTPGAPRGDSILSTRTKQAGRALLSPIVRLALALHITANMVTVFGLLIVIAATILVGTGYLLIGARGAGLRLGARRGRRLAGTGQRGHHARSVPSSTRRSIGPRRRSCTAAWPPTS